MITRQPASSAGRSGARWAADGGRVHGVIRHIRQLDWDRLSFLAILVIGPIVGYGQIIGIVHEPFDFDFYWRATDFADLYAANWLNPTYAYVYPPPMAQVFYPFHALPYTAVRFGWTILCFVSLWYCAREWTLLVILAGMIALFLPNGHVLGSGLGAVLLGNVQMPMAAGIVAGMRHPSWWAVPILTKVTTGVGVLWFAFRGEWRLLIVALGTTILIGLVSFVIAPAAWNEYLAWTVDNYGKPSSPPIVGPPLPLRIVAAVALLAWGARTNRTWVVPIACGLAIPGLYGWTSIASISLGALALRRSRTS